MESAASASVLSFVRRYGVDIALCVDNLADYAVAVLDNGLGDPPGR